MQKTTYHTHHLFADKVVVSKGVGSGNNVAKTLHGAAILLKYSIPISKTKYKKPLTNQNPQ